MHTSVNNVASQNVDGAISENTYNKLVNIRDQVNEFNRGNLISTAEYFNSNETCTISPNLQTIPTIEIKPCLEMEFGQAITILSLQSATPTTYKKQFSALLNTNKKSNSRKPASSNRGSASNNDVENAAENY